MFVSLGQSVRRNTRYRDNFIFKTRCPHARADASYFFYGAKRRKGVNKGDSRRTSQRGRDRAYARSIRRMKPGDKLAGRETLL